jgi:methylated-DNA-[protein]-cysteine S-methyltransferase
MRTQVTMDSPIGELTLVSSDGALSGLLMHTNGREHPGPAGSQGVAGFERAIEELTEYFSGERARFTVPVVPHGDIARALGDPALAREVGAANARNPIAIVVPCHRVIGSDGSLTGYAGGLERKRYLLDLEAGRRPLFVP